MVTDAGGAAGAAVSTGAGETDAAGFSLFTDFLFAALAGWLVALGAAATALATGGAEVISNVGAADAASTTGAGAVTAVTPASFVMASVEPSLPNTHHAPAAAVINTAPIGNHHAVFDYAKGTSPAVFRSSSQT